MRTLAITVLQVEDDPLWAEVVAKMLSEHPEIKQVGSASTGEEAIRRCDELTPSLILLDLLLPDIDGLALIEQLTTRSYSPRIIAISCRADEAAMYYASTSKIFGFLWKNTRLREFLFPAICSVAHGIAFYPPDVRDALRRFHSDSNCFKKILSDRELSLLPKFGKGESDRTIATALCIAEGTVHSHRVSIMRKLGLHRTEELMRWALEKGFSTPIRPSSFAPTMTALPFSK